jgi:hypothetical protein
LGELLFSFFEHYSKISRLKLDLKTGTVDEVKGHWIYLADPFTNEPLTECVRRGSQQHKRIMAAFREALDAILTGKNLSELIS